MLAALLAGTAGAVPGPALAIDPGAGTSGAAFTKIGLGSARALSMGQAYVALAEGTDALTWNPAGLALSQQREWTYSYARYIQDIESPMYMGYAHPLGRFVIGANIAYMTVDGFDVRDELGRPVDGTDVRVQNGFATLSLARSFWYEKLFLGGGIRAVHEDNDGTVRNVVAGDFGAILKPSPAVSFGYASQNFGAGSSRIAPVTRVGASVRTFGLLTTSLEVAKPSDSGTRLGLGAEFMLPEDLLQVGQVYLRVGYRTADDLGRVLEDDRSFLYPLVGSPKLSFGLGLFTTQAFGYGLSFDYALVSLGALGTADMMTLKIRF